MIALVDLLCVARNIQFGVDGVVLRGFELSSEKIHESAFPTSVRSQESNTCMGGYTRSEMKTSFTF